MSMNGGQNKVYSAHVVKLNRSMKPQPRVYVLTDTHLYRLDNKYNNTKGSDPAVVIHTTVRHSIEMHKTFVLGVRIQYIYFKM